MGSFSENNETVDRTIDTTATTVLSASSNAAQVDFVSFIKNSGECMLTISCINF